MSPSSYRVAIALCALSIAGLALQGFVSTSTAQDAATAVPQWAARLATPDPGAGASPEVVRGRYLAIAGDCTSCHTREGREPFAGGVPLTTQFGVIFGANLTPDRETGIGAWNGDQFYRALHSGIRANGAHLYPAFPYTSFTRVSRADSDALLAYLQTLPPVRYRPPPNQLPPIVNIRAIMALWNAFFFHPGGYRPDPAQSQTWNRGAYLVTGLGHCDGCHTPRNLLGGEETNRPLHGGRLENWHAANLAGDLGAGLGGWSDADISEYLRTGRNAHAAASGMMGQVIVNSTSQLSEDDRQAMVVYLRSLAPAAAPGHVAAPPNQEAGSNLYRLNCAACHGPNAEGIPNMFPRLANNSSLQARDPTTLARIVLEGTRAPMTAERPTPSAMPAFGWKLNDHEIAALLSYLRGAHGNTASPVRATDVARVRAAIAARP